MRSPRFTDEVRENLILDFMHMLEHRPSRLVKHDRFHHGSKSNVVCQTCGKELNMRDTGAVLILSGPALSSCTKEKK